jgi:hypothetical protein
MLTAHSMNPISIHVEEATVKKDYDELVNKMILEKFAEEMDSKAGVYKLLSKFSEQSYTFSYGVENLSSKAIEFTVDCNTSRNMIFSENGGKITKIIEAG